MFRMTMICTATATLLLALPPQAFAQQVEEQPNGAPLFGALVGGLIGGAIGAAVSRRAPHAADFVPAAGGLRPPVGKGGKAGGGGGGGHKGAPAGAPMHRKPGK